VKTERKPIENARLQEEKKERKKEKINQSIKSDCEVNELLIRMNAEANRACKTRPCKQEYSTKEELRQLASDGCPNLSFEFEATTDREEEEGSSGALKSLAANVVARSLPRSACRQVSSSLLTVSGNLRHNVASLLSPPYCATAVATWTVAMCDTCRGGRSVPLPQHLGNVPLQGFFFSGDHP